MHNFLFEFLYSSITKDGRRVLQCARIYANIESNLKESRTQSTIMSAMLLALYTFRIYNETDAYWTQPNQIVWSVRVRLNLTDIMVVSNCAVSNRYSPAYTNAGRRARILSAKSASNANKLFDSSIEYILPPLVTGDRSLCCVVA